LRKPVRCLKVWWPMIRIDQWVKYLASHQPRLLLGGQLPDPNGKWKEMFSKFWSDYKDIGGSRVHLVNVGTKGPGDPPFKSFSYMLQIPGSHAPKYITLDYLHIYHLGYGMDASASSIVLLCKLGHFGAARALDDKLEVAYNRSGNTFPTTVGGKAFDVGLIMAWLEDDL
ncbi:unnamed protein product, partial [Durusdinium trenchii]